MVEDVEADSELLLLELERGGFDVTSTRVDTRAAMQRELETSGGTSSCPTTQCLDSAVANALAVLKRSG